MILDTTQNDREKNRDARLVITMTGNTTEIRDPAAPDNVEPRKFAFDYSYWSHDGFEEREDGYFAPVTSEYADQVSFIISVLQLIGRCCCYCCSKKCLMI